MLKEKYKYKIIIVQNNKQIQHLKAYVKLDKALAYFNLMLEENKKVIFPIQFVNTKAIKDVNFKLVLLKRREKNDEPNHRLRNDYGEYVEHDTTNKEWLVYNIAPYNMEEHFWAYGFHPFKDRKTFKFIYNNFVKKQAQNKYNFLNITLFKNKILFETSSKSDMVICKNITDAIRMYNLIEEFASNDKLKYIMFSGNGDNPKYSKKHKIIEKIQELTGWNSKKIRRSTTRP